MIMDLAKVFFAGTATYLTPCVYPLIPVYLSTLVGTDIKSLNKKGQLILRSIAFSLGFVLIFALMGLGAAGIGRFITGNKAVFQLGAGIMILFFAFKFLGFIDIPILNVVIRKDDSKLNSKMGLVSSFLMGIFFAAGWSPCIGPILGSVLTYTASQTSNPIHGMIYLGTYGLGFAVPLIITAAFAERGVKFIGKTNKFLPIFEKVIGVVMVFTALYFFSGLLNNVNASNSGASLKSEKPQMVEFYSKTCTICDKMKPVVANIQSDCSGKQVDIKLIDISEPENRHYIKKYNIIGVPTFVFMDKKGDVAARLIGEQTRGALLRGISAVSNGQCEGMGMIPEPESGTKNVFCTQ
jgi:cytochrome c-type biogenesis protein